MVLARRPYTALRPGMLCSSPQAEPVQGCGDLLIGELPCHLPNRFDGLHACTVTMLAERILSNPQLGVATTGPVQHQHDLARLIVNIRYDFVQEDADDPLLRRMSVAGDFQIAGSS